MRKQLTIDQTRDLETVEILDVKGVQFEIKSNGAFYYELEPDHELSSKYTDTVTRGYMWKKWDCIKTVNNWIKRKESQLIQDEVDKMTIPEFLNSKFYSHYRVRNCGVQFYKKDEGSPTGVSAAKGCETEDLKKYLAESKYLDLVNY